MLRNLDNSSIYPTRKKSLLDMSSNLNKYDDSKGMDRIVDQEFDKSASKLRFNSVRTVKQDEMETSDK